MFWSKVVNKMRRFGRVFRYILVRALAVFVGVVIGVLGFFGGEKSKKKFLLEFSKIFTQKTFTFTIISSTKNKQ